MHKEEEESYNEPIQQIAGTLIIGEVGIVNQQQ